MNYRTLPRRLLTLAFAAALVGCDGQTIQALSKDDDPAFRLVGNIAGAMRSEDQIPLEEERNSGRAMAAMLLGAAPLLRDDEVQRYVNTLGRWIAMHSERPDIPWRFGVIDDDDLHAFALPGGYILISTGLLRKTRSEAELAGVLAHEIVHTQNRHHLKAWRAAAASNALKDGLTLYAQKRNNAAISAAATASKGFLLEGFFERGLDKGQEYEADAQGVVLAARSGYNPYALIGVLQTLGELSPADPAVAQLFNTHPQPQDRIARLNDIMGDRLEAYADGVEDSPGFQAMRKRLPPPKPRAD